MKISILMPTFNHQDYILDALQSVANQTFLDWELLIGDDCSIDDTSKKIRAHPLIEDSRCKLFERKKNVGIVENLNQLISVATGEILTMTSGDDLLDRCHCEAVHAVFTSDDGIGCVFTPLTEFATWSQDHTQIAVCHEIGARETTVREFFESGQPTPGGSFRRDMVSDLRHRQGSELCDFVFNYEFMVRTKSRVKILNKSTYNYRIGSPGLNPRKTRSALARREAHQKKNDTAIRFLLELESECAYQHARDLRYVISRFMTEGRKFEGSLRGAMLKALRGVLFFPNSHGLLLLLVCPVEYCLREFLRVISRIRTEVASRWESGRGRV